MAILNTNDFYLRTYLAEHPETAKHIEELSRVQNAWLTQYGVPVKGGFVENDSNDVQMRFAKVKQVQIELLTELKRVCDANNLKLFLIYGSLLGAVRSGGMIDGDDDIDVALLREDYDKLVALTNEFKEPYFLQNNYNDNCFFGGYIKLRYANTTAINPQNWYVNCCEGIFIDIFPLDVKEKSFAKEKLRCIKIKHLQRLLYAKSYGFYRSFMDMPLLIWKFYKYAGKLLSRKKLLTLFDDACRTKLQTNALDCGTFDGKEIDGDKVAIYTHYTNEKPKYLLRDAFVNGINMTYEGLSFLAPKNFDDVLFDFYEKDYLIPRNTKAAYHAFYDAQTPYKAYKKRFTSLFVANPPKNKKLILVGDEPLIAEYKKRFTSASYKPHQIIVLEDCAKTVQNSCTQDANCKDAFTQLDAFEPQDVFVVIAAFNFVEIEKTIKTLGFEDYCFYVHDRNWLLLPDIAISKALYKNEHKNNAKNVAGGFYE